MNDANKTLTVVGATGNLAIPVIRLLLEKEVQIKTVVRNPEKSKEVLPEDVEILYGDVTDVNSLKDAFKGSRHIYINLNTTSFQH